MLAALPIHVEVHHSAVADFQGQGQLRTPPGCDHAGNYLERADTGPIAVTSLDTLKAGGSLAIKIDVEGGEAAVLRGAERLIREADAIVIALEAHPEVSERTGRDPVECLRLLQSFRPFRFVASETGAELDPTRPVFDQQLSRDRVHNILCVGA